MDEVELQHYADLYKRLVQGILLDSYLGKRVLTKRLAEFELMVAFERDPQLASRAEREQLKRRVPRLLAKALLHHSNHPNHRQYPTFLRQLSKAALAADTSAEVIAIMKQAQTVLFPTQERSI